MTNETQNTLHLARYFTKIGFCNKYLLAPRASPPERCSEALTTLATHAMVRYAHMTARECRGQRMLICLDAQCERYMREIYARSSMYDTNIQAASPAFNFSKPVDQSNGDPASSASGNKPFSPNFQADQVSMHACSLLLPMMKNVERSPCPFSISYKTQIMSGERRLQSAGQFRAHFSIRHR